MVMQPRQRQQLSPPQGGATAAPSRSFETPEERALRQKLIVRQSSITAALELVKLNNPKGGVNPGQVIELAEFFDDWVWSRGSKPASNEEAPFADMADDIPL